MSTTLSWLQPPSRALIVGVNEYENQYISNLQGCVRDALDVATFLFADLGMPANHIRLLTSPTYTPARGNRLLARHHLKSFLGQSPTPEQERLLNSAPFAKGTLHATRANIIEGIRDFLGNAAPGEEVLFYYSGHGSTNNLKEEIGFGDEKGETLVPADAGRNVTEDTTSGDGLLYTVSYQILNRELRYLVAELLEKGIRITIMADSCHSGGVVRNFIQFKIPESLTYRQTSPSRALIVGVNKYESPDISNLEGSVRDALDVATFLCANLAMPANQIRLLTSPTYTANELLESEKIKPFLEQYATPEQKERLLNSGAFTKETLYPTRANMIEGIRNFLGNAAAGEEVFFYYSGHGLTNKADEKSETLLPADTQMKLIEVAKGGSEPSYRETGHILGRELRSLVAELEEKGIRLTMVIDEHSGPKARLTSASHSYRDLNSLLDGQVDFTRLQELYSGIPLRYTHIAGCLATELSYEVKGKDRRYRGAMTSALLRTLREIKGAVTYRELGRVLRGSVPEHANKHKQHPNITGVQERLLFSNQTIRRSSPLFAVQKVRKKWIELDGGQLEGVNQGSILTCYSDWSLSTAQGEYKVIKSRANAARAEPIMSSNPVYPKIGQPLMLKTRADRPSVFFDKSAHKIAQAWREREITTLQHQPTELEVSDFGRSSSAFGFDVSSEKEEASQTEDEAWQESSLEKTAPYLIEVFSEDADYRVSVEQQMLVVKRRDDSLVEALHKEIYDPESNHPTTIPFNKQRDHRPDSLSSLLDRIINYQTFVAKKPRKRDTLKLSLAGEKPDVKVEVEFDAIFYNLPLTEDRRFPLPAGQQARLHVTMTNQSSKNKDLFVNLYYLDPKLYFAQRIWPSDGTDLLQARTSRSSIWQPDWQDYDLGGLLNLKLFVSTEPLNLESQPCGPPNWRRGTSVRSVRALKNSSQGWNAYHLVLGATKDTSSGSHFF